MLNTAGLVVSLVALIGSLNGVKAVTLTQVTPPVIHGEGPHWDAEQQVLYFVDISGQRVYKYNPSLNVTTWAGVGGDVGFVIPVSGRPNRLMAGVAHDLVYFDWSGDEDETMANISVIATVDHRPGQELNRFNDAKADVSGRLWAGTMGGEPNGILIEKQGSLYSLETTDNVLVREISDVDVSNGLIWNADNTLMYYIDSPSRNVDVFDFDLETGTISGRRSVFNFNDFDLPGVPDGMTIDANGHLWVAIYDGGRVIKVDPQTHQLLQQVEFPAAKTTSATFGGANMDVLFVSTSRRGLSEGEIAQQPKAGSVFAVTGLGVKGVPAGNNKVVRN